MLQTKLKLRTLEGFFDPSGKMKKITWSLIEKKIKKKKFYDSTQQVLTRF